MSTAGALHLAESLKWMAYQPEAKLPEGALGVTAIGHMDAAQVGAFLSWYRGLPK